MTDTPDDLLVRLDAEEIHVFIESRKYSMIVKNPVCQEAAARIRELEAMVAWRGIETVKADESVMIYVPGYDPMQAVLSGRLHTWMIGVRGFYGRGWPADDPPTHWKPLPPPPVTK